MVQAEGFGWQRCAASADLGGAAAAGVIQVEAGDRSKGRGFAMSFDFLTADDFRGFIWGSFPRPIIAIYSLHLLPTPMMRHHRVL